MLRFWNFFLDKKQFSYVLIGALVIAGLYALIEIPKENYPSIDVPYGIVTAAFPGASAADTESLVTDKLEEQIGNIANIDTMTSSSATGLSLITVQFNSNADTNQSIQNLRDAVAKAVPDLPTDVLAPAVTKLDFDAQPVLVISISGDLPPTEFSQLGRSVSDELKTITGVSSVDLAGVPDREVDVIVNKQSLAQYGLSLSGIIGAIAASNAASPAGTISMNGVNYDINFKGGITDPSQMQAIAVGSKNGNPIYLRDVALISDGLAPASTYSRISVAGKPSEQAITLLVYKQSTASITTVSSGVKAKMQDLESSSLKGLTVLIDPSTDQGTQVNKQLGSLTQTGLETVGLVILVLLLTIGWRESLVAALSIPLSFLIAFIGLLITGNTLNFISLFALILAVGILVDSGIVVTEAVHARMKLFATPMEAARAALHDYAWPLMAGTMATVAVFAPLFFLTGLIGKFIAGIPYTLIFVLVASIFVALGIVPLVAILFTKKQPNRLEELQEEYTHRATEWYKHNLRILLESRRFQRIFLATIALLFFISLLLPVMGFVQAIFFAQTNEDFVYINIEKPEGTTLATTDLAAREVEEILYRDPDVASFTTTVGRSSDLSGTGASGSNQANITVDLPADHTKTSTEVLEDLERRLAPITDATIQVLQPNNGPSAGAPITIQFTGSNLNDLISAADAGKQLLSTIPDTTNITSSTQNNGTELDLTIDRAKTAAVGLTTAQVAQTLRAAINGMKATAIPEPDQDIDVVVKLNLNTAYTDPSNTNQTTLDSIEGLTLTGTQGPVLLGSILDSSLGISNATINHKDKMRIETVSGYPDSKTSVSNVVAQFQKRIGELHLPTGVAVSYGGDTQEINTSFTEMFIALIAGLVLMFMILIIAFNSFRYTLYLLMIVPLSLIGVLDGLALTGQPLSFPSLLGFIALGGVIINHAIILMDSMIHLEAAHPEKPIADVVIESAAMRLRPIFLTTVTTVFGMIPLAGAAGMWGPLAFTIMFGLSFAIILTLVLVPVLFYRNGARKAARAALSNQ
ncbi:MAG TPA: efflux RND transporter permease subunit [Candidatus Paceibacterota bacterium]|nr:efflux RND transporter permease subunit [Candidatus Paceibacterota bacterium]